MYRGELLYSGKAKSVYKTDNKDFLILQFRNDTSAFDGKKVEQLERKGMVEWDEVEDPGRRSGTLRRFAVTPVGVGALRVSRQALETLWDGLDLLGEAG